MRISLVLISFVVLQSCAVDPLASYRAQCPIYDFKGELTDALVAVPIDTEKQLLSALPKTRSCPKLCWYQKANGNIEGYSEPSVAPITNTCPGWTGYEFEQRDGKWVFLKEQQYMVLSHSRKH